MDKCDDVYVVGVSTLQEDLISLASAKPFPPLITKISLTTNYEIT